jgi:hypothetical protein
MLCKDQHRCLLSVEEMEDRRVLSGSGALAALLPSVVAPLQSLVAPVTQAVSAPLKPVETALAPVTQAVSSIVTTVETALAPVVKPIETTVVETVSPVIHETVAVAKSAPVTTVHAAASERVERELAEGSVKPIREIEHLELRSTDTATELRVRDASREHSRPENETSDTNTSAANKDDAAHKPGERKHHGHGSIEVVRLLEDHEKLEGSSGTERAPKEDRESARFVGKCRKEDDDFAMIGPRGTTRVPVESTGLQRSTRRSFSESHVPFRLIPLDDGSLSAFAAFDPQQLSENFDRLLAELEHLRGELSDWLAAHGGTTTWVVLVTALTAAELVRRRKARQADAATRALDEVYLAGAAPVF